MTVEFEDDDMASYDYKNAKAYVLEKGDYNISINSDSHTVIGSKKITVDDTITYDLIRTPTMATRPWPPTSSMMLQAM